MDPAARTRSERLTPIGICGRGVSAPRVDSLNLPNTNYFASTSGPRFFSSGRTQMLR